MVDAYRSALWHEFRQEILRLDGYACTRCGRQRKDGVRLHVHHKLYLPGHKPWEYPHDQCDTLCSGCHATEHGITPPNYGWTFVGYDDLGDLSGECEKCGTAIRHSFLIEHEKWGAMEVGEFCCDYLTCSQAASDHVESLVRYRQRRKAFVSSPRWQVDYAGELSIKQKGIYVSLVKREGAYRIRVRSKLGKKVFATELDAKAGVFDLVESGVIDDWLKKQDSKPRRR